MKGLPLAHSKGSVSAVIAFGAFTCLILTGCFGHTEGGGGSGGPGGGPGGASAGTTGTPGVPEVVVPVQLLGESKGRHAFGYDFLGGGSSLHWTDMGQDPEVVKPPAGAATAQARGVSQTGALVGTAEVSGADQGFYWSEATSDPVALPVPAGYTSVVPLNVNSSDQIVGSALHPDGETRPCFWPTPTTAPVLLDVDGTLIYGAATDINDAGVIAGRLYLTPGQNSAVRWSNKDADAFLLPIGTGVRAVVNGISADGTLVGAILVSGNQHAAMWQPGSGTLVMLPEPPNSTSTHANAIEGNIIVGFGVSSPTTGAIFWENGVVKNLNDFVTDPTWFFIEAEGIGPDGLFMAIGAKGGSGSQTAMIDIK